MKIARFTKRIIAYLIDELIPLAAGIVFLIFSNIYKFGPDAFIYRALLGLLIAYGLVIIFSTLGLYFFNGFTLGGSIIGIRVMHVDGGKIKFKEALLKSILLGVIAFAIINAVYMLVVRTERSVFDRLTDTYVAEYRHALD